MSAIDQRSGEGGVPGVERILLVEDDEILAEVLTGLLSQIEGVRWTDNAEEALRLLPDATWDLIVADIELPGMNGIEMINRIKEEDPHAATLIISGNASFDYAIEAIRAGADDYMTKPLEPDELLVKANQLIEQAHASRAADHQVVLAIGAHPDDVEIGIGGILLRHGEAGHDVNILTLTGGEHGGDAAQRAEESRRAAEILGARLFHETLRDTEVGDRGETIGIIHRVIEEIGATTIYTHTAKDVHQDHRNVHNATLVAARGRPRVYCYQAPSTTVDFRPTRFVSIDRYLDKKLEAIDAFASQTAIRDYLDHELLRSTARYWARFSQSRYVEPLEVVREADVSGPAIPLTPARSLSGEEARSR